MMVSNRITVLGLLGWQWRHAVLFTIAGVTAQLLHIGPGWTHLWLPSMPLAVVGGAIGIFASFRTNSCYARWWEGRVLWGRVINFSRTFASQAIAMLPRDVAAPLVRRQMAYAHLLRCSLRDEDPWRDAEVLATTTDDERALLRVDRNPCFAIMHMQREAIEAEATAGRLSDVRVQMLDASMVALIDAQGGCERIKKTPFPRGYGFIVSWLIAIYGCAMPFGMVRELGWVTVPFNLLACMSFLLISEVGRVLEDPFTHFWNALPLSALASTIEANLRQRLGETTLPPAPKPDDRGILM